MLGLPQSAQRPRRRKGKAQFTGADIDGFYAPDIASAALANFWTKDTLVQFLKADSAPQKTVVFGPMAEVSHGSLRLF